MLAVVFEKGSVVICLYLDQIQSLEVNPYFASRPLSEMPQADVIYGNVPVGRYFSGEFYIGRNHSDWAGTVLSCPFWVLTVVMCMVALSRFLFRNGELLGRRKTE